MTDCNTTYFDDPLLETAKLVEMTGTTPQFWENLRTTGGGPEFIKVGRLVRYRKSAVDRWLLARTVNSTTQARNLSPKYRGEAA